MLAKAHLPEDRARAFVICLPDRLYLRLFEAVTAMAFGHVLNQDMRQTRLGELWNECRDQAGAERTVTQSLVGMPLVFNLIEDSGYP